MAYRPDGTRGASYWRETELKNKGMKGFEMSLFHSKYMGAIFRYFPAQVFSEFSGFWAFW